ncbi:polysaccharide deacetylase family protein [Deinococcus marmoris]|uniref:Polysaccharide deacetylase family protein n=1 Tax=Deinococcus marmoris TaxID=249408 RepID=A0A1U7NR32_9DEIO|nr:polysaccharide deacetylase family protein [Deinococcus marmoris]OLV15383.1 polysaccharide deacetylase family protein [Deinococcus marmoris]
MDQTWQRVRGRLQAGRTIRAVNFHNTPQSLEDNYRRQFEWYAQRYVSIGEDELTQWFETGGWTDERPGLILSFYNGYRNNFEVARPLLEEYGLRGWFFVPSGFVSVPVGEQADFAAAHHLSIVPEERARPGERLAMSWDEVRELRDRHVVASHTRTHAYLDSGANLASLHTEIVGSQRDFEAHLGHPVRSFAWLFGRAYEPGDTAAALLREAGYSFLFANTGIHRLPA